MFCYFTVVCVWHYLLEWYLSLKWLDPEINEYKIWIIIALFYCLKYENLATFLIVIIFDKMCIQNHYISDFRKIIILSIFICWLLFVALNLKVKAWNKFYKSIYIYIFAKNAFVFNPMFWFLHNRVGRNIFLCFGLTNKTFYFE